MKYYAVAEIDITDQNWVRDYVKNVTRLVERAGGRYLARTSRIETKPSTSRLSWPDERYYTGAEEKPPKPKPRRRSPHWPRSATAASSPGASLGTVHGNAIRTAMSSCTSWMVPRVSPSWRMVGRSLSR